MSRAVFTFTGLLFVLPLTVAAQSAAKSEQMFAQMPPTKLHSLLKTANSPAQFLELAEYFRQEQARYNAEATTEKVELDRRTQINAGLEQKYPRPVDSAKYLYQFYLYEAEDAARQARHYGQLASGAQSRLSKNDAQ